MDPSGAFGAMAQVVSGVAGEALASGDRERARALMQLAADQYNIPLPELERLVAEQLGPSAMEGVAADPTLEGAQYDSLASLGNIADNGGQTLTERANYEQAQRDAAMRARAQRQSIVNVLNRSGTGGSGVAAAMQLGAARDNQEAGANAALKRSADSERRALEAVLQRGRMAGDIRGQQFGEQSARASAADIIARYNASARSAANSYNAGLGQQHFNNSMSRAAGRANAYNGQATQHNAQADRTRGMAADIGAGVNSTIQGFNSATRGQGSRVADDDDTWGDQWNGGSRG